MTASAQHSNCANQPQNCLMLATCSPWGFTELHLQCAYRVKGCSNIHYSYDLGNGCNSDSIQAFRHLDSQIPGRGQQACLGSLNILALGSANLSEFCYLCEGRLVQ